MSTLSISDNRLSPRSSKCSNVALYSVNRPCSDEVRSQRAAGLYADDAQSAIRVSHKNPNVQAVYAEFLKEPNSEKAHHLLHTHYVKRELYK